jgi:WD domain, G-beta repeat
MKALSSRSRGYQATAISASCKLVALVTLADFTVHDVSRGIDTRVVCWGDITQRCGPEPKIAIEQKSFLSYNMAALGDEILAIASFEVLIDIRNAKSGERINQVRLDVKSPIRCIILSPDGGHLVVGLKTGDIFVFSAGVQLQFSGPPIRIKPDHETPVTSIAISQDSLLMAVAREDNTVCAYRLQNLATGHFRQWRDPCLYRDGTRSKSAVVCDLALYMHLTAFTNPSLFDAHSLFLVPKHRKAHPITIKEITSKSGEPPLQILTNGKQEGFDYRVACTPRANMLAAALVSSVGEFHMTYLNPGSDVWATSYHTEIVDLDGFGRDGGYCSVGFSETRALALDRFGRLLGMDFSMR